jgi:spectinomycin phosphotransferase/16S rRNA (guanine(1405)-N(7))-methyltransferase
VLSPPEDLSVESIAAALGMDAAALVYRPVGFGSHHWSAGDEWFVTVDDLETKRLTVADSLDAAFERLTSAIDAARALRADFVVAPIGPPVRVDRRYAAALYPFVAGESFGFGAHQPGEHRDAVLAMLIDVHSATGVPAPPDDFVVPHRDVLEAALGGAAAGGAGPFEQRTAALICDNARAVGKLLDRYDTLAAGADPGRAVLTHGEPHRGNTMRTADGWRLIDWDTALIAPPERDLWLLGGDLTAYTKATGVGVLPDLLEMYRLRWDIADLAVDVDRFRRPHTGTPDDAESFAILHRIVAALPD